MSSAAVTFGGDGNVVCSCGVDARQLTVKRDGPNKGCMKRKPNQLQDKMSLMQAVLFTPAPRIKGMSRGAISSSGPMLKIPTAEQIPLLLQDFKGWFADLDFGILPHL
jgi:hypothetical protein